MSAASRSSIVRAASPQAFANLFNHVDTSGSVAVRVAFFTVLFTGWVFNSFYVSDLSSYFTFREKKPIKIGARLGCFGSRTMHS